MQNTGVRPEWRLLKPVIPAQAGIQLDKIYHNCRIRACAGMTERQIYLLIELK